jgi:guanylate kinase
LAKAEYEMTFAPQFDHIIVNDDLETAKKETLQIVERFLTSPDLPKGEEDLRTE